MWGAVAFRTVEVMAEGYINPDALEQSLGRLRGAAVRRGQPDGGLVAALRTVLDASRHLFSASGAGYMMLGEGSGLRAVAATDDAGRLLESRQEEVGRGPCVDTLILGEVTCTEDLAADDRWPELLPELPDAGVRAVLGVPTRVDGGPVGAINVYREHPHRWDESEIAALRAYGTLVEELVQSALQAREHERLVEQLQHALDSRVVIERAVGVIMAEQRTDAVRAFNHLRGRARSSEQKVADLAAQLLHEISARA